VLVVCGVECAALSGETRTLKRFDCAPSWRIRLKARVDLGYQTAEFMPFEVIRTAILSYTVNLPILISVINVLSTGCARVARAWAYYDRGA